MFRYVLFLLLFVFSFANAYQITGTGYGYTKQEARSQALTDLASQLLVHVSSDYSLTTESDGSDVTKLSSGKNIKTETDVYVSGADVTYTNEAGSVRADAVMSTEKTLPMYESMLSGMKRSIDTQLKKADQMKGSAALPLLQQALSDTETYERVYASAVLLGSVSAVPVDVSSAELTKRISDLKQTADSIKAAADILCADMPDTDVYVYPPVTDGGREITPFADAVRTALAAKLGSRAEPDGASAILTGEYIASGDGIILNVRLSGMDGKTRFASSVKLSPLAYKGLEYRPKTAGFDSLLYHGLAVSEDFHVSIATDRGTGALLYKKGETMRILVKTSAPAYIYVSGYTSEIKKKYAYLLELANAQGDGRFVRYINADDANKWVSLGEFEVVEPFGTERLHVVASAKRPDAGSLPKTSYDDATGLFIIDNNPVKALGQTRSIINKTLKKQKDSVSEAVLTFTTMK